MARTSLVHYIAPSAISLTPNCNGSANDIAVYISRGAKIRVYSEAAGIPLNGSDYQEWTLTGRNRRLADSTAPYTIYARLLKADVSNGYLVFVKKQQVGGVWKDKYPYVIKDAPGLYMDVYGQESQDYYYIRLGDVSLPQDSKREITLDTGILGTPQYNEEWNENPDNLPLRVEIGCTVADEDAGPTPYVFWGQSLVLTALLVKGWDSVGDARLDHWEIQRNADVGWPDQQRAEAFAQTGVITINHSRGSGDDFQGAVQTVFNITAWGYEDSDSSGSPVLVELGKESVCILAETIETFDLVKSSEYVNYNPMTGAYVPASGIDIGIRATDQKGDVFDVTVSQFSGMGLQLSYAPVGSEQWTPLTVSGQPQAVAMANIPVSVFHQKQSINVRLCRTVDGDTPGTTVTKELKRSTIAFVADGEDTNDREWIYKQDNAAGYDSKTGTAHGQAVSGKTGDDWNADLTDDFVPTGWSDNALPVSAQHPDVYTSWRDYDREHDKWGDFQAPIQWSHWGEQGTDGDGVQYLYKLFDHELTDAERISNIPQNPVFNPTTKEWEAAGWYDDPQAPTSEMPFCYCSVIQHIAGQWGTFQKLGMWSKWSEDGRDAAACYVERQVVFVPTDTSGVVLEDFQARVPFRVYAGNERLDVTDASIDEGSAAHYAHLFGGIMGITGSVASTKLSITGASVSGTKLMLGSKYVVGSSEVVIEVKKGVVLDEHMAALTVYARNSIGTEYTTYANIEILSNGIAKDGDTPLSVYKWSTSPDTPPAISGNDYPPAGWSKSAPDRPEGDSQYLWVSNTVKRGDGTVMDWGRPVRISGNDGSAGEDAKEREWIYKVSDTNPGTPENPEDRTIDDYVPAGWNDNPTGVTATARTEWASWRDFDHETQLWGDFHAPVVWSHYGENGMDGDGVEYVFIRTTTNVAPTIVNSPDSREDSHGHTYLDDEYLPLATGGSLGSSQVECTDNPAGTSKTNPYEWVAKRTKGAADPITGKRTWEKFSGAMSLWANFSRNAIHLDLDNEMDMVSTDSAGKIEVARTIVTHATLYDGAQAGTTATLVSTAASLVIGGVTPTVSISDGVVTASWVFTRSNTLAAAATVSIVVQYDGVNRSVNFTVAPSLGEAILQLSPSMSSVPFGRDASGSLTPASRAVGLSITRIDGQSTTDYSTAAAAGVTVRYSKTAMPSSASAGTGWASGDITVDNTDTILYIAMFNSAGTLIDKETIPTVKDGKDGKSITKTGETYRYATNNTGVRPAASSSDWSTVKPVLQKGYWLYTETTITWSDTSTTILYTDERNPNDGAAGQDIIVDGSTIMKYYVGDSNTTHPAEDSSDWKDLNQVTQTQGKWLWSQATTWYRKSSSASGAHDGGKSVNYNVSYISKDGKTGRGISSITEYYQATNSSAARQAPTSETGWDTDPNLSHLTDKWDQNHKYLWNMEKTVYSNVDGSSTTEYSIPQILAIWTKDGAPGQGIDSVQNYYKVTNSLTPPARTDTGWSSSPVAPTAENPYLYNYEEITWVNPASTTYTAVQMIGHYGRDGISVRAQYSTNGTSWHNTFAEGDEWMRTSTDNGSTWSTPMKIVGENGSETDFTFGISKYKTTASAQTAPGDISTWSDAPMAVTDAKPYLWSKVQQKDGDGNVTSTRYIRLTGEEGDGTPVCILDRTAVFVPTDSTGKVLEPFSLVIPFRVQMGNAVLAVKSASVSEEGSARYVSLHGGKLAGGYMSVSGTKVSLVGGVSGTKVSLSSSYVAGPSGVIVNVPENVTLDEHLAGITVDVVDRRGVAYTAYGSFEILGKSMAKDGTSQVAVFKWSTSGTSAPAISGTGYPPAGWSVNPPSRPEGDSQFLWASYSTRYSDGTITGWGTPVRISGNDGSAGEDAKEREWIYKRSDSNPGTPENPSDRTIDDYVPSGWSDNPAGVDDSHKTEWASWRDFDHDTQLWGDFQAPIQWSHYGERGMDGDGVEYVFIRTNSNVAPTIVDSPDSRTDSRGHKYTDDEYLPLASGGTLATQTECTDDPAGTDSDHQFEWVAKRIKVLNADGKTRTWQKYSGAMSLWANWSEDGEDAVNIIASPASVLVNQDLTNTDNLSSLSEVIMFTAMKGNTQLTVSKVEITSTNHCTVNGSNSNTGTITSILKTGDVYYDNGDFVCSVRYNDGGTYKTVTGIKIKFYANLLGTWKESVEGGVRTIVADEVDYEYLDDVLTKNNRSYTQTASAAGQYDKWQSDTASVSGSKADMIQKTTTAQATADGVKTEVTAIKTGKNMLKGALSGSNFRCETTLPYPSHPPVYPDVDDNGWMTATGYTSICTSATITSNKWYVISFYTKTYTAFDLTIWKPGSTTSDWTWYKTISFPAVTQSEAANKRRYAAFKLTSENVEGILICFPVTTLRYPQLELGVNDGDDDHGAASTPTAFEVDSAVETSSRISQSADHIEMKVKETGIDINENTIRLSAEKTTITGDLTVPRVMNVANGMMTTIEAGKVRIESTTTPSYGLFQVNADGEIVLKMVDKNGHVVANIGGSSTMQAGSWETIRLKRVDSGGVVADTKANFTAYAADVQPYYKLTLGRVDNGGIVTYYTPDGNVTNDPDVIALDGYLFTRSADSAAAIKLLVKVDGYYVKQNNGIFYQEATPTIGEEGDYFVQVYHYYSGKMDSIDKHTFTS